jgi:hypothetical protein
MKPADAKQLAVDSDLSEHSLEQALRTVGYEREGTYTLFVHTTSIWWAMRLVHPFPRVQIQEDPSYGVDEWSVTLSTTSHGYPVSRSVWSPGA